MVWEKILRPFTRSEVEQQGRRVDLNIRRAQIRSGEDCEIVHNVQQRDYYVRVETNVFKKFGFDSVRVSAGRSGQHEQTLFRTTTASAGRPQMQNPATLGVEVYLGDFSGEGRQQVAVISPQGDVGVFEWNPLS
jgi:hypothetical protein